MVYHLIVDEGQENIKAKAYSKDNGQAFIAGSTLQACIDKLPEAQRLLEDALRTWEPGEQEKPLRDPKQERRERMQEFENSTHGKRFLRSLALSKEFLNDKRHLNLRLTEMFYLSDRAAEDGCIIQAFFDVSCLAFRNGYKQAQKNSKGRV